MTRQAAASRFRLILSTDHYDSKILIDPDLQLSQELAKPPLFVAASAQVAQHEQAKAEADAESFRAKYPASLKFD